MKPAAITATERQDVISIGRKVRSMEIEARILRRDADTFARAGNVALAGVYLAAAEGAAQQARQIKALWQRAEGFREGYVS